MKKALGIDIGGTKISYAIIDENGKFLNEIHKIETPKTKDEIFDTLACIVSEAENDVDFIAIATAGAVNKENTKVIGSTANLPFGYKDIDFSLLSNKKVFIENDANSAAYAEFKLGAAKNYDNSITLTLGTGVGSGIIINGKLLKGKSGAAGEMHFMMERNEKRLCTCGAYDCFEAYASGNGLRKTAIEIFNDKSITTYDVIEKAKNNDKKALETLDIWQKDIALGILGLNNIFDTDCFILSGSMEQFVDTKKIEDFVNSKTVTTKTKVFNAKMGNYSGMIGVALLGFDLLNL